MTQAMPAPDPHQPDPVALSLTALPHAALAFEMTEDAIGALRAVNADAVAVLGARPADAGEARALLESRAPGAGRALARAAAEGEAALEGEELTLRARAAHGLLIATLTTDSAPALRAALDALPVAVLLESASGRISYFNPRFKELSDGAGDALRIGARLEEVALAAARRGDIRETGDAEAWARNFVAHQHAGVISVHEKETGRVIQRRTVALPQGGYLGWALDITDEAATDQARQRVTRQRAFAARLAKLAGWRWRRAEDAYELDEVGLVDPAMVRLMELGPRKVIDSQAPELRARNRESFRRCLLEGAPFEGALALELEGETRWLRLVGEREMRRAEPVGVVGIVQDVTEQMRRERDLQGLSARFEAVMNNVDGLLVIKNSEGRYLLGNRRFLDLFGDQSFIGCNDADILPPEALSSVQAADRLALNESRPVVNEVEIALPDGARRQLLTTRTPYHDPILDETALCLSGVDVTDLKELQAALEQSSAAADAASRAKSQFLATISHEVRTPLNGVIGMAHVLERELSTPAQRRMLTVIMESAQTLLRLFDDILDWSRIETGNLRIEREPLDLAQIARRLTEVHRPLAEAKGLAFTLEAAPGDAALYGDRRRIAQILHQLLSNAVKFTETGEIVTRIGAAGAALEIVVRDTGIGMAAAQAETVYEMFSQADMGHTRRHGGAGLGLSIVKGLVDAMGGTIALETGEGVGAAFHIRIPDALIPPGGSARSGG